MTRVWRIALFGIVVGAAVCYFGLRWYEASSASAPDTDRTVPIMVGANRVNVMLAQTPAEQERGLGGRPGLAQDEGMLFVFPRDGQYKFWMKDMSFAIDMLWIDASGRVIYIQPAVSPDTYPQTFGPDAPARYVLELPADYARAHGIALGARASLGNVPPSPGPIPAR